MFTYIRNKQSSFSNRLISVFIACTFASSLVIPPQASYAQNMPTSFLNLPAPGTMISTSPGFTPALIKGVSINPNNPLQLNFIVNTGDTGIEGEALRDEAHKLIKYFMAALTVPEDEMWVNLSPYEEDRIIPDAFGTTEMGRDLLAQDYLLKQLSASLIYPDDALGKKFWDRVYKKASQLYGTTDIPVNTFNKIWIVPDRAAVYEYQGTAYVVDRHLKVMLEEDYLAMQENIGSEKFGTDVLNRREVEEISEASSQIVKEVLIPEIEKEVNEGQTFANLRQIYNSMILATWFKLNLKETLLGRVYADQNKVTGIDLEDTSAKEKIYQQYLEAFQTGVYDFIKEEYDPASQEVIPRKYFSGGFHLRASDGADFRSMLQQNSFTGAPRALSPRVRTMVADRVIETPGTDHMVVADTIEAGRDADREQLSMARRGAPTFRRPPRVAPWDREPLSRANLRRRGTSRLQLDDPRARLRRPRGTPQTERFFRNLAASRRASGTDAAMTSRQMMGEIRDVMDILSLEEYARTLGIMSNSLDAVAFVNRLVELKGPDADEEEILDAMMAIPELRVKALKYRIRRGMSTDGLNLEQSTSRHTEVTVGAERSRITSAQTQPLEAGLLDEFLLAQYEAAKTTSFPYRDDMIEFVGRFMGLLSEKPASFRDAKKINGQELTDLEDELQKLERFLRGEFGEGESIDLEKIVNLINNGIGANEMYLHQLAQMVNLLARDLDIDFHWEVVDNPADLERFQANAINPNSENTLAYDMSRSGGTTEPADFMEMTSKSDGPQYIKNRIVWANGGRFHNLGERLVADDPSASVLHFDNTPGNIGGRHMNLKTGMVFGPLFTAFAILGHKLYEGDGDRAFEWAREQLKIYVANQFSANNELTPKQDDIEQAAYNPASQMATEMVRKRDVEGRVKMAMIFDPRFRHFATEIFQNTNEGTAKPAKGDERNNNMFSFWDTSKENLDYMSTFMQRPELYQPVFIVDMSSEYADKMLAEAQQLIDAGVPVQVIKLEMREVDGTIEQRREIFEYNLAMQAQATALMQTVVTTFTHLTDQDANSNPAVKTTREVTSAIQDILVERRQAKGSALTDEESRVTLGQIRDKLEETRRANLEAAQEALQSNIEEVRARADAQLPEPFVQFADEVLDPLAERIGVDIDDVVDSFAGSISWDVFTADVAESGGKKSAQIDVALDATNLGRYEPSTAIGRYTHDFTLPALLDQVDSFNEDGLVVSFALPEGMGGQNYAAASREDLPARIARYYLDRMSESNRSTTINTFGVAYMDADTGDMNIEDIMAAVNEQLGALGINALPMNFPRVAHTGIEAAQALAEIIAIIGLIPTQSFEEDEGKLGSVEIRDGLTVNKANKVYNLANVARMAMGGSPTVIFEYKNREKLSEIREILIQSLELLANQIDTVPDGAVEEVVRTIELDRRALGDYRIEFQATGQVDNLQTRTGIILENSGLTDPLLTASLTDLLTRTDQSNRVEGLLRSHRRLQGVDGAMATGNLLLLDDRVEELRSVATLIEAKGMTVFAAQSPVVARELLEREDFVMVVSDFNLGSEESGADFLQEIADSHPDIKLVLISGAMREDDVPDTLNDHPNFEGFIPKGTAVVRELIPKLDELFGARDRAMTREEIGARLLEEQSDIRHEMVNRIGGVFGFLQIITRDVENERLGAVQSELFDGVDGFRGVFSSDEATDLLELMNAFRAQFEEAVVIIREEAETLEHRQRNNLLSSVISAENLFFEIYGETDRIIEAPPLERADKEMSSDGIDPTKKLVLVVDDNPSVLRGNVRLLRAMGYQTLEASSSMQARILLDEYGRDIDMVLTDRDIDEDPVTDLLRFAKELAGGIPVVLTSGRALDRIPEVAQFDAFLPKPVEMADLQAELERQIGLPKKDSAMTHGGIDLNPALLDLQIKRDGNGIPLPISEQPFNSMQIEGFIPVIINITPINNMPLLLGLGTEGEDSDMSYQNNLQAMEPDKVSLLN